MSATPSGLRRTKMGVPVGVEPTTVLKSRAALTSAGYKPDVLPIELGDHKVVVEEGIGPSRDG